MIDRKYLVDALVEMNLTHKFTFCERGHQMYHITHKCVFWTGIHDPFGEIEHTYMECLLDAVRTTTWQQARDIYQPSELRRVARAKNGR